MADRPRSTLVAVLVAALAGAALAGGAAALAVVARGPGTAGSPPPVAGVSASPLGTPAAAPPGHGGWVPLQQQPDGAPVAWDPCRPVPYVVTGQAPPTLAALLDAAVTDLAAATGLRFVAEGPTAEQPAADRASVQPERYGRRWAPVLVAWSDPQESPALAGGVLGYAGPRAAGGPGELRYVTGSVVLDAPQLAAVAAGQAGLARARAVLRHELGHLAGLGHVDDPGQLMYHAATPLVVALGDGDRRGLAALGAGPCSGAS